MIVNQFINSDGRRFLRGTNCFPPESRALSTVALPLSVDVCVCVCRDRRRRNRVLWYPGPDTEHPQAHGCCVESLGDGESGLPSMSRADVITAFPACHRAYGTC